jgi:hypothetical protein
MTYVGLIISLGANVRLNRHLKKGYVVMDLGIIVAIWPHWSYFGYYGPKLNELMHKYKIMKAWSSTAAMVT